MENRHQELLITCVRQDKQEWGRPANSVSLGIVAIPNYAPGSAIFHAHKFQSAERHENRPSQVRHYFGHFYLVKVAFLENKLTNFCPLFMYVPTIFILALSISPEVRTGKSGQNRTDNFWPLVYLTTRSGRGIQEKCTDKFWPPSI